MSLLRGASNAVLLKMVGKQAKYVPSLPEKHPITSR